MTYPETIDSDIEEVEDGISALDATTINRLRNSVVAIERELGTLVSSTYGTLKDRFNVFVRDINASDVDMSIDGYFAYETVESALPLSLVSLRRYDQRVLFNAVEVVEDGYYVLSPNMPFNGRVEKITTETESGTCDLALKIADNELALLNVSASRQEEVFLSSNSFFSGDELIIVVSNNSNAEMLKYAVVISVGEN